MSKYFGWSARLVSVSAIIICSAIGGTRADAAVKVIGDFEGTFASGYPDVPDGTGTVDNDADTLPDHADWFADRDIVNPSDGFSTPPVFVSASDPQWGGAVTHGNQALLFTFPQGWQFPNTRPFLRLHGYTPLMSDTADYSYLMLDITTFGHPDTAALDHPLFRQVFPIFNGSNIGFYDRTNGDIDVQQDIPPTAPGAGPEVQGLATGSDVFRHYTLVVDMTGPAVPYPHTSNDDTFGDGKTSMQYLAQQVRTDNNDGTPIANFAWQLLFAFQGDDEGDAAGQATRIKVAIDNIRFCSVNDPAACQAPAGVPGDYNNNGKVDAGDYVLWRKGGPLQNEVADSGTVSPADYTEWRARYGNPASGAGTGLNSSTGVPEPTSVLLAILAFAWSLAIRRR
jgi:hypothetical protein